MIKRLTTEEEVAELIGIEDEYVEDIYGCTKGEWIQWLISKIRNESFWLSAIYKDNKPVSYLVGMKMLVPPIANGLSILYARLTTSESDNSRLLEEFKEWGRSLGVEKILFQTSIPEVFYKYGFKEIKTVMELKL